MGLFGKKKEEQKTADVAPKQTTASPSSVEKTQTATISQKKVSGGSSSVLVGPHVTEKSHTLVAEGKYVFRVLPTATKRSVKYAVEKAYNVDVVQVHMVKIPAKRRTVKYNKGYQSSGKKAIVTLKKGETIALFETA